MAVKRVVIHEIIKEQKSKDASLFLSDELLPNEPKTERLATLLNNAFSRDDVIYGIFKQDKNEFFFKFSEYLKKPTDETFKNFTQEVTEELQGIIKDEFLSKGGFLVFTEYEVNKVSFFGIYLIRDVEGMLFHKDESAHKFDVNLTKYMDTNKLAMGCRINIDKLSNQDSNHLSLIKSGQSDISGYFYGWIGVDKPESNKAFTDKLFNIVSDIPLPINPDSGNAYNLNEVRELAYNSIRSSAGKVVNLRQLSFQLYGNESTIPDFVTANGLEIDSEFKYDSRSLTKFKRIEANRDGIRLAFSRGDINSKVKFSDDDPELITIRSKKLADAVKEQIKVQ
jgi:nucleoid-associated protein YejK